MPIEVIEASENDIIATAFVEAVELALLAGELPHRELAAAMVARGGGILVALDGRPETAAFLRELADRIEKPHFSGEA